MPLALPPVATYCSPPLDTVVVVTPPNITCRPPLPIVVNDAMWVPDRGIATTIAQAVLASIAPHRRAGGWYDLAAESVASAVHLETFRLYPNAVTVPHQQLIAQWCQRQKASA